MAFQKLGRIPSGVPILNLADSHHCEPVAYEAACVFANRFLVWRQVHTIDFIAGDLAWIIHKVSSQRRKDALKG
jgi:hypothetical protein